MKKIVLMLGFLCLVLGVHPALAHPPGRLDLTFDVATHVLKVMLKHTTRDSIKHYINTIVVSLNKQDIITQKFSSQKDNQGHEALYMILDVKPGDVLSVKATCSLYGTKSERFVIPSG